MQKRRAATIFTRLFFPIFLLMILQSAIFYIVTVCGNVVSALNDNAEAILSERVDNRRNELEARFNSEWANLDQCDEALDALYARYRADYSDAELSDPGTQRGFLVDAADSLIVMLRKNGVNGAFVILNTDSEFVPPTSETRQFYGLCIRDYDQNSAYTDKEDLLVERSPSSISAALGCSLDSYWEALYSFDAAYPGDFYYKPLRAAYENPGVSHDNLAYFCGPHTYSDTDPQVVSYSRPLIADDGRIYGVLGVEMSVSYLTKLLPDDELAGQDSGAYLLVQYQADEPGWQIVATNGTLAARCFGGESSVPVQTDMNNPLGGFYDYTARQGLKLCMSVQPLSIYNRNTPFERETFALVGVLQQKELYSVGHTVRRSLMLVTLLVLLIGSFGIFIVSHFLTRPIKQLAQKVRTMKPEPDVELEHINIREIDQLVDSIEGLSRKISQTEVRTEFFSRMSHDMRTPMNAIIGFSSPEVIGQSSRAELMDSLEKINGSGKYLLGLINEVLDMTKIDSGRMEIEKSAFELKAFWEGSIPMIDELALQRGVHFEKRRTQSGAPNADVPDGAPAANEARWVLGDSQRLSQVVVNLLSNAVKFTPEGGTVALEVEERELSGNRLVLGITVRDNGIGMSEAFQKKLYQPFTQEHSNREGTGLGLSIAHRLVQLMGGTIECRSKLGQGTEFVVSLEMPRVDGPASATGAETAAGTLPEAALKRILSGRRVLLCEDHPLNRQIACRLLERMGVRTTTAENGKLGAEAFAQSGVGMFDAVLMDIRMPVMDGLEAARTIRAMQRPDAATVPILAMTANAFREDIEASAAAGMNAHLSKPIEPQKLYQALAEKIAQRDAAKTGK